MMVVGVDAHKLTEPSCPPKFAELADKTQWKFCQTNDGPVNVDDESVGSVNFRACRKTDVWVNSVNETRNCLGSIRSLTFNA
jgi:hypothetical protein